MKLYSTLLFIHLYKYISHAPTSRRPPQCAYVSDTTVGIPKHAVVCQTKASFSSASLKHPLALRPINAWFSSCSISATLCCCCCGCRGRRFRRQLPKKKKKNRRERGKRRQSSSRIQSHFQSHSASVSDADHHSRSQHVMLDPSTTCCMRCPALSAEQSRAEREKNHHYRGANRHKATTPLAPLF